jgi:hypothetical protein
MIDLCLLDSAHDIMLMIGFCAATQKGSKLCSDFAEHSIPSPSGKLLLSIDTGNKYIERAHKSHHFDDNRPGDKLPGAIERNA